MSDLLEAASEALETPPELVQRSAAARAAANDTTVDEVLAAWAGDGAVPSGGDGEDAPPEDASPQPEPEAEPAEDSGEEADAAPPDEPAPPPGIEAPPAEEPTVPVAAAVEEPEPPLEPEPLGARVRTAVRVGAWAGAALGLVGFLAATALWAPNAAAPPDSGPVVVVDSTWALIGVALASVVFGAVVASLSRAATGWARPAMRLSSPPAGTLWVGALAGLLLGVIAGAALTSGFATPVEASEGMVEMPVLSTLVVMILGGAVLGATTAALPQLMGTPVAVDEAELAEATTMRSRLAGAVSVPMVGLALLVVLVLPFAYALLQSQHLAPGVGAALVAIITSAGILGFATLAGSRPQMRVSLGDLAVALVGIGTVVLIVLAVLFYAGSDEEDHGSPEETVVTRLL